MRALVHQHLHGDVARLGVGVLQRVRGELPAVGVVVWLGSRRRDVAGGLEVRETTTCVAWVTALLIDVRVGNRVRDGGMQQAEARKGNGYTDLATFVLTGQPARLASSNRSLDAEKPVVAPKPAPVEPKPVVAEPKPSVTEPKYVIIEQKPVVEQKPAVVEQPSAVAKDPTANTPRAVPLVIAGAGLVAVGVGLGTWFAGADDRAAFANAVDGQGVVNTQILDAASAGALEQRVGTNQAVATGLMIGGGVVAVAGTVLFFALAPSDAPKPTVMLSPNGAYAGIAGTF